jgi:hypothetical protein
MTKKPKSPRDEIIDEIKKAKVDGAVLKYAEDAKKDCRLEGSQNKYNDLPAFDITDKDMEEIKKLKDPNLLANDRTWTSLEKFFYAVLWKDGKLESIKRIIDGMESALDDSNASPPEKSPFVYYYFGRHLINRIEEPLVDRHTLRAFCLIQERIQGKEDSWKPTLDDAKAYRDYFLEIRKKENLTSYKQARLIDSLFFALGKYAKKQSAS